MPIQSTSRSSRSLFVLASFLMLSFVSAGGKAPKGVVQGQDSYEFHYTAKLPELSGRARMWLPLAESDAFQTVEILSMKTPGEQKTLRDGKFGNRILFLELEPGDSGKSVEIAYAVTRKEKSAYSAEVASAKPHLDSDRLTPVTDEFREIAQKAIQGCTSDRMRARALYTHVLERMKYLKEGDGWGKGDAVYACDARTGNCTDFHAYFIALARSVGLPARFAIGASIPHDRNDGAIGGYHCWAEIYADGQWCPVDISEADKHPELAEYYSNHHPANRFEMTRGRDLELDPSPESGPVSFLVYPLLEVKGESVKAEVAFSFERK